MDNRQTRRNALVPLRDAIELYLERQHSVSPLCLQTMADLYCVPVEHIEERLAVATQHNRETRSLGKDRRGTFAILFAGLLPGLLGIASACINAEYSFVQASKVRGCAENAALALVQTQDQDMAAEIAQDNGCQLQNITLTRSPPAISTTGTLTGSITYQPVLWPGSWQVSATISALQAPGPNMLAAVTSIQ